MFEIILLAGALSVELEPYAVENPEADTYGAGSEVDAYGRHFQWSTKRSKLNNSILFMDSDDSGYFGDVIERDVFGRPVEGED